MVTFTCWTGFGITYDLTRFNVISREAEQLAGLVLDFVSKVRR